MIVVGTKVNGRYSILRALGEGGGGSVYLAEDSELNREVALKMLHAEATWEEESIARFRREAKSLAKINHRNVVRCYSYDLWHDKIPFLVCELCEGRSLRQYLPSEGLPWKEALAIAADVCRGLDAIHAASMVHRDVKPENLVVTADGVTKIVDFGLSKPLDSRSQKLTATGMLVGTPAYMSPEQASGAPVVPASDLYSLGCVLFEMLCGKQPFAANEALGVIYQHTTGEFPSICAARDDLPKFVEKIIRKATARELSVRYSSAIEMLHDIDIALADKDPLPDFTYQPRSGGTRASGAKSRRLVTAVVVAMACVILMVSLSDPGIGSLVCKFLSSQGDSEALEQCGMFFKSIGHKKAALECLKAAAECFNKDGPLARAQIHVELAELNALNGLDDKALEAADSALQYLTNATYKYHPPSDMQQMNDLAQRIAKLELASPILTFNPAREYEIALIQRRLYNYPQTRMLLQNILIAQRTGAFRFPHALPKYVVRAVGYAAATGNAHSCLPLLQRAEAQARTFDDDGLQLTHYNRMAILVQSLPTEPAGDAGRMLLDANLNFVLQDELPYKLRNRFLLEATRTAQCIAYEPQSKALFKRFVVRLSKQKAPAYDKEFPALLKYAQAVVAYEDKDYLRCVELCQDSINASAAKLNTEQGIFIIELVQQACTDKYDAALIPPLKNLLGMAEQTEPGATHLQSIKERLNFLLFLQYAAGGDDVMAERYVEIILGMPIHETVHDYDQCHNIALRRMNGGDLNGARRMLDAAFRIANAANSRSPINNTFALRASESRGAYLRGRSDRAIDRARMTIQEAQRVLGPDHPFVVSVRTWLHNLRNRVNREELMKIDLELHRDVLTLTP